MSNKPKIIHLLTSIQNEQMEKHNVKKCIALKLFYDNHKTSYAFFIVLCVYLIPILI